MVCSNPNCKRVHENVRGKCPHCGADFRGHIRPRHVTNERRPEVKAPFFPLKPDECWVRVGGSLFVATLGEITVSDEHGNEWVVAPT
jgi:hypothetical protein